MKTKFNQSNRRKLKLAIVSAIIAAGAAGLGATSYAATASDNMAVSTTVAMSCTITANALTFSAYDPTSASDSDATANIQSSCTSGGSVVITMGQGGNAEASSTDIVPVRRMSGSGGNLGYAVYTDTDRMAVWGNTAATGNAYTASGGLDTIVVYGRIPGSQAVGAGSFSDSVAVTLTY